MPKVDVSAMTITFCIFECIDLVGSMLMCGCGGCMFMCLHACIGLAVNICIVLTYINKVLYKMYISISNIFYCVSL